MATADPAGGAVAAPAGWPRIPSYATLAQGAVAAAIAAFLLLFLITPVGTVIYVAFADAGGGFTLAHFNSFFQLSLMQESFWNSLYVAAMSVVFASIIALGIIGLEFVVGSWPNATLVVRDAQHEYVFSGRMQSSAR